VASMVVIPWLRIEVLDAQGAATAPAAAGEAKLPEIVVQSNYPRGQWYYNPPGLYIQKGQRVRWTAGKWGATITAFHPNNMNHELRIPEAAKPFDSGILGEDSPKYNTFEWAFDVEGTYDYFSKNHEVVGLVGRIVVGTPGGPAEKNPPGYGNREGRAVVYPAQAQVLNALASAEIVAKKSLPYPRDLVVRRFPYGETR
jgi:plastocyanin